MPTPLPEELPRYVIDEGVATAEKETKILPEEQERILMKLIQAAGHSLREEERTLMFRLQEKLQKETERVKALKKINISEKPLDEYLKDIKKKSNNNKHQNKHQVTEDGEEETSERLAAPKQIHIVGFKPEEVVRRYIECWNQQKFGAEYDCFSRSFLSTDRSVYIQARQLFYQQQLSQGGLRITFDEINSSDSAGGESEVIASKTVQSGNKKSETEKDLYRLKLEKGHWVIYSVEPV